ncbi:MAG: hypothetical protein OXU81_09670 [Gammaproteobacteria bacterium]|nr:hypothetical protein [Gammaproteobacteria bacterium]
MKRQLHRALTAPALTATLALATAAASADSTPFTGSWVGTWPHGLVIELTVNDVDSDGSVTGLYCNLRKTGTWFADLQREGGTVAATVEDEALKFKIGKTRWQFRPGDSPDVLELTHKRSGKNAKRLTLARTDAPRCASRITPLP